MSLTRQLITWFFLLLLLGSGDLYLPAQDTGLVDLTRVGQGRSKAVTSSHPDFNSNMDRRTYITPGETFILADIKGPGIINHIWLTFNEARPNWLEKGGSANPAEIVMRMYWDGHSSPAVEAPLGDFFGAGFGLRREIRSDPVTVEGGDGYNCYWQMPFHSRAKITVTNEGDKNVRSFYYHIDYCEYDSIPADSAYFCAQYRREFPQKAGQDYLILAADGPGHYVGTVMSVRSRSPFWFGEGDVRIYIDGDRKPTIQGTGTEDYFLCAWGLNECLFPTFGCTYMGGGFGALGTRYTLYRWHIADPIRFSRSIRFEIEHSGWISADETSSGEVEGHVEREDDMATVAFWYQQGQPRRFATLPPYSQRVFPNLDLIIEGRDMLPGIRHSTGRIELQKGYEWTGEGQIFFLPRDPEPYLELDFFIDTDEYRGIILRYTRSYDYGMYRIKMDGKAIADYHEDLELSTIDMFARQIEVKEIYLGSRRLLPGKHTLRFEYAGTNPLSRGNSLGFDSVRLRQRWNKKRKPLK